MTALNDTSVRMGNIGEPRRTVEIEPLPLGEPLPAPVPTAPDREVVPV